MQQHVLVTLTQCSKTWRTAIQNNKPALDQRGLHRSQCLPELNMHVKQESAGSMNSMHFSCDLACVHKPCFEPWVKRSYALGADSRF